MVKDWNKRLREMEQDMRELRGLLAAIKKAGGRNAKKAGRKKGGRRKPR